ncbi:Cloroperoxidase [Mycena kentingensis (nom. inval.)]|nr:Cloroperoxidase [Mycena kentingensis (nom. inval.)]
MCCVIQQDTMPAQGSRRFYTQANNAPPLPMHLSRQLCALGGVLRVAGSLLSSRNSSIDIELPRVVGFNPQAQLVSTTGAHAYRAAAPSDFRGPCPGLNAMANHGYINRNGMVGYVEAILVAYNTFGMGLLVSTLASTLALYGADLLDPRLPYSIGEKPPPGLVSGLLGGLVGQPKGMSDTHNQFESDSSATRCDLGESIKLQPQVLQDFLDLYAADPDPKHINAVASKHHANRVRHSIANNPYFFYGPIQMVSGLLRPLLELKYRLQLVTCITTLIPANLFSNHSAEFPDGYVSPDVLLSFYGARRTPSGTIVYTRGSERIPDLFYRRPDDWNEVTVLTPQMLYMWTTYPETLIVGGNTGTRNSFIPLDMHAFTRGAYGLDDLLKGHNAMCFLLQAAQTLFLDTLDGLEAILEEVLRVVGGVLAELTCPELRGFDMRVLEQYPGWRMSQRKKGL